MATPRKGKAKVKITSSGKKVSYGQAGQAKGGGPRVKPGTSKESFQKKSKMTLIHRIICLELDGNVQVQNQESSNKKIIIFVE